MDNDVSHAVEERFAALEARVAALEGNGQTEVEEADDQTEVTSDPVITSRSRRSGRSSTTVDDPGVVSDVSEGGVG